MARMLLPRGYLIAPALTFVATSASRSFLQPRVSRPPQPTHARNNGSTCSTRWKGPCSVYCSAFSHASHINRASVRNPWHPGTRVLVCR
eukprot:2416748-Prymnesium_polylepis.2